MAKNKSKPFIKSSNVSGKGGTGKTTLTALEGDILASRGYKVLLVDLNTQSDLTFGLGADIEASGIGEYLIGKDAEPNFQEVKENLYVLNGGDGLNSPEFHQGSVSVDTYAHVLEEMRDKGFDVVITDIPPEKGLFENMGIYTSDCVNVIMSKHPFSQRNGKRVLDDIVDEVMLFEAKRAQNRRSRYIPPCRLNVTLNNVERIKKTSRLVDEIEQMLSSHKILKKVSHCVIHKDAKIDKPLEGKDVPLVDVDGSQIYDDDGDVVMDNVYKSLSMFANNKGMQTLISELNVLADWVVSSNGTIYK